jgi:hypothetical protein
MRNEPGLMFMEAAQKLKRTVTERRTFDAAQVKIVGLADVRRAAGNRWDAMKTRVRTNSMNFLQGALGEEDILIPCGDGFLIIYADGDRRDLSEETETLQTALNTFYMGDEALSECRARVTSHILSSRDVVGLLAGAPEDLLESAHRPAIKFAPVCNIAREAITSYFATPVNIDNGLPKAGYNPDYRATGQHADCDFATLDLTILDQAISEATRVSDGPQRCLVGFSTHITTLKNRAGRERILERLRATPIPIRRHLVSKIAEIDAGTPLFNLVEWVGYLRHTTSDVSLEFHPSAKNFDGLENTRATAAGFVLPLPPMVTAETRARCHTTITRWRLALQRQRMRLFVDGVNDAFLLSSACNEAVDYVTSDLQWPLTPRASGVRTINKLEMAGGIPKSA